MTAVTIANCSVVLDAVYGDELKIVNAARASFGKESEWQWVAPWFGMNPVNAPGRVFNEHGAIRDLKEGDKRLIRFLARGYTADEWEKIVEQFQKGLIPVNPNAEIRTAAVPEFPYAEDVEYYLNEVRGKAVHFMPFCHVFASFKIKCPIFLTRQLAKHQIGLAWSEESRRYLDDGIEIYMPKSWRKRPRGNIKQGSSNETVTAFKDGTLIDEEVIWQAGRSVNLYNKMIDDEVAPEQARMVLPLQMMTSYTWSGSLLAFSRIANLRMDNHAQVEVRDEVVRHISEALHPHFPNAWPALVHYAK